MTNNPFQKFLEQTLIQNIRRPLLFDTTNEVSLEYSDVSNILEKISKKINHSGFAKGDIVLTYTPLNKYSIYIFWSCLLNGQVFVPVDHNWPQTLVRYIIEETKPKFVLTDQERLSTIASLVPEGNIILVEKSAGHQKIQSFDEWTASQGNDAQSQTASIQPEDLAVILYTSGSTGRPKGVMLSHRALLHSSRTAVELFQWTSDDIFMNLGDLHSMSGLRNTCLTPLQVGASFIIATPQERNNILCLFDLVRKFNITYIGIAPIVIREMNILFSKTRKELLSPLKALLCTGGTISKEQLENFYNLYQKPVLNYYGLTETSGICSGHNLHTFSPIDTSIGHPVNAEFIIVPDEMDKTQDDIGELLVKSEGLMSGYFNNENATNEVLNAGCFATGDIVKKRLDGCYELLGRKRNIIKSTLSELIYLEEIDNVLESHPLIREACACRYSRFEEEEKIVAFIVLDSSIDEIKLLGQVIRRFINDKVGVHRTPWRCYIEKSLPRNSIGKIQREELGKKVHEYIRSEHQNYF
jgi:acyl-coenzyme A synthetase/AMP-(fatty) acid ligase